MTDAIKALGDAFIIVIPIVGIIVWLVRLEGKGDVNREMITSLRGEVQTLTVRHEQLDSKTVEELARVRESLARIEGALGVGRDRA